MIKTSLPHNQSVSVFDITSLDIDIVKFADKLRASFECLPWDNYELRGRQSATLRAWQPERLAHDEQTLKHFLAGECELSGVKFFDALTDAQKELLQTMKLRRKRAVATFLLSSSNSNAPWHIERHPTDIFVQTNSPFYPDRRKFSEMEEAVVEDHDFQKIIGFLPTLFNENGVRPKKFKAVCHQVSLIATHGTPGHGSPEGIHQDGADFIVSALVIQRDHVEGGISRLYHRSATGGYELDFTHLLQPGQGLFHADRNTPIWHDVTPITPADGALQGVRNTLGFDLEIIT